MSVTSLQLQARALGDPTRHEIFRYVAAAGAPVGVAELTAHLGLHHNAIRQHLAKLVAAALVTESTAAPSGRGRPRLEYEVAPDAGGRWGITGPYERLAVLLAEVVRTGDAPEEVGRRAALADPAEPSRDPAAGAIEHLVDEMARQGFDPLVRRRDDAVDVILQACPFASAVIADPGTVCDLHLGLARGVAERVGGIVVDDLVRQDPRRAHCRLSCREVPPSAAPDGPA